MPSISNSRPSNIDKRVRKGVPKSRHGCCTCKIRHTKCDETRPFCRNCVSTGRKCEGFVVDIATKPSISFVPPTTLSFFRPRVADPLQENEAQHLNAFRHLFISGISGYTHSPSWEKLILQAAQDEPAVRHAAIAFSALQLPRKRRQLSISLGHPDDFALQEYEKAIKCFNKLLSHRDRRSIEAALLCSILCICFETIEGSLSVAQQHLESGLRVVSSFKVDEKISNAFARLDVQAASFVVLRTPSLNASRFPGSLGAFTSLCDAETHLYQHLNRIWTFIRGTANHYRYHEPHIIPIEIVFQSQIIKKQLLEWNDVFQAFLNRSRSNLLQEEVRHTKILQTQYYTGVVLMAGSLHPEESVYDSFDDIFQSIVGLSEDLLSEYNASPPANTFSMEMGVTQPLYFTAIKCRLSHIREKSISLLQSVSNREGIWNSLVLVKIARKIKQIEEEGLDEMFLETFRIPEFKRVHSMGMDMDEKARRCPFSCRLRPNGMDGEWEDREEIVLW